ncbi:VOC family protein [Paenibacillus rhizovicinus]|uniref:VOC family protein n=1 Tax=Paenibacillus rhizovicinus TaxID=2704463 RepID=A0A6C0P6N8_9BACL|nr:VOC family protein [Paenibacillus rhizovicinus]QHW34021.1 VOC family protein [Paenibacillus rhizovicinus]
MSPDFAFTRIGYVYVPTTQLGASIAWYTDNLAFKLINKFQDRGSYIAVLQHPHLNAISLLLIETSDNHPLEITRNGKPFPIMAMNCPDIEGTHRSLKDKGLEVEDIQTLGAGEAKYFYFRDNEGNLLEAAWSIWDPKDGFKEEFEQSVKI